MQKLLLTLASISVLLFATGSSADDSIDMVINGDNYTCYRNQDTGGSNNLCECIVKKSEITGLYWWAYFKNGFKMDDGGKNGGNGTFFSADEALERCQQKTIASPICYIQ